MDENPGNKTAGKQPDKPATDKENSSTASGQKTIRYEYVFAVVVLLVFVAGGAYLLQQININRQSAAQIEQQAEIRQADIAGQVSAIRSDISKLATEQDVLKSALADLDQQQPQSNEDWALSEVEYLLIIASHRLLLERDVNTALSAMEAASLRLQSLSNPDLIPVREQLTADMNRLRAVNQVETTGLAIYLADLIERADELPVRKPELNFPDAADSDSDDMKENVTGWRQTLGVLWQELKSLVVIRKSGDIRKALLMPEEEYFLGLNLRLELENARLAVLRRDTGNLHTSITLLQDWLARYYDTSDAAVSNIMDTLTEMESLELKPELPDINSSLETLRAYMREK